MGRGKDRSKRWSNRVKIGTPSEGGFQHHRGPEGLQSAVELQLQGGVQEALGGSRVSKCPGDKNLNVGLPQAD